MRGPENIRRDLFRTVLLAAALIVPFAQGACGADDQPRGGDADADADTDSDTDADSGTEEDAGVDAGPQTFAELCAASGNWYDETSGLCWQNPAPGIDLSWSDAGNYCDDLTISEFSDWHLPTISELRSLIRGCEYTVSSGECPIADDCLELDCFDTICNDCSEADGPADGGCYWDVEVTGSCNYFYWASQPISDDTTSAWGVHFRNGAVFGHEKSEELCYSARCVRGEP